MAASLFEDLHHLVSKKWVSCDHEIGLHLLQCGGQWTSDEASKDTMGLECSAWRISKLEFRRPQPERITAHKPIMQVKKVWLRVKYVYLIVIHELVPQRFGQAHMTTPCFGGEDKNCGLSYHLAPFIVSIIDIS